MIPIQNIYYMLSYAFQALSEQGYRDLAFEPYHHVADLCAAILSKGIAIQVKRGLHREYRLQTDALSSPRGRIELSDSIRTKSKMRGQLVCTYDDFSVDNDLNRVLKTTILFLLRSKIDTERKKALLRVLVFFEGVQTLPIRSIRWNIQYNRNNQTYRMLIGICQMVMQGLLQTTEDGSVRLMDFLDEQHMHKLYEKFIFQYYYQEFSILTVRAPRILWAASGASLARLPAMQSDVVLSHNGRILIIDAKYYARTMQMHFDKPTIHSHNLYQIFTYVKNEQANQPQKQVSGMLLYARTDEETQPDEIYQMSGNQISVRTLDLNRDFAQIAAQLDEIVQTHFGIQKAHEKQTVYAQ